MRVNNFLSEADLVLFQSKFQIIMKNISEIHQTNVTVAWDFIFLFIPNPNSKNVRGWHIKYGFVANNITKTMND